MSRTGSVSMSAEALGSRFRAHPSQPSRWTLDYDPFAADLNAGRALMRSELVEHREADVGFVAEPLDRPAYALQFRYCSGALFAALARVVPHFVPPLACMTASRSTRGRPPEASSNGQWLLAQPPDLILASLVSRQLDQFGSGQKETFGQYPRALIRASPSFDGLEQTARVGS